MNKNNINSFHEIHFLILGPKIDSIGFRIGFKNWLLR